MCGRTACTLNARQLAAACGSLQGKNPRWQPLHKGEVYEPSYNLCPQRLCPVLCASETIGGSGKSGDYVLCLMRWGFRGTQVINCRIEECLQKPMFRNALLRNQRCVAVCEGFYEWKYHSQPYFIYSLQPKNIVEDMVKAEMEHRAPPLPLLTYLAAVFDVRDSSFRNERLYSFALMTQNADSQVRYIHHRMPVVLDEAGVHDWLNPKLSTADAIRRVRRQNPPLVSHQVNQRMGSVSFDGPECILPVPASIGRVRRRQPSPSRRIKQERRSRSRSRSTSGRKFQSRSPSRGRSRSRSSSSGSSVFSDS